ncbi:MAG TPA: DUF4097 family beta strand repeat-containing protein [Gemmatimonadaceae bacterium]|nr:DUF4097 family beta strand repeat-containing protein [Gemmatimonadaceae bacterium]
MRLALVGMLAAAIMAVPDTSAAQTGLGRDVEVWTWQGRVDSGRWFRLSNVNGAVTITPSSDNQVHVRAEKNPGRNGDIRDVSFAVVQSGGDIRICALNFENDRCDEDGLHSSGDHDRRRNRNVSVKFTVQVPRGVRVGAGTVNGAMTVRGVGSEVRASTVNGGLEVSDASGQVTANTVNGSVRVTTSSGPVSASTVNGSITARMGALSREGDMKFSTVNGGITVETPSSLDANVTLDTMHGGISSDFPVTITGKFGPRHAEGTIGRGGRRIKMSTVNGSVELRKAR